MPLHLDWSDVAVRLLLTLLAGALIGFDRGERGHAAGLRTTMLVCLAASISMIQLNLMLPLVGKTPESFSVLDIMRLPLGILSGMGFIGAGAILRKGDTINGVTTAATLWTVTVIGLCIGGGQLLLGTAATALVWLILYVLRGIDSHIVRQRKATLVVTLHAPGGGEDEVLRLLRGAGVTAAYASGRYQRDRQVSELTFDLRWRALPTADQPTPLIDSILALPGVESVQWNAAG